MVEHSPQILTSKGKKHTILVFISAIMSNRVSVVKWVIMYQVSG